MCLDAWLTSSNPLIQAFLEYDEQQAPTIPRVSMGLKKEIWEDLDELRVDLLALRVGRIIGTAVIVTRLAVFTLVWRMRWVNTFGECAREQRQNTKKCSVSTEVGNHDWQKVVYSECVYRMWLSNLRQMSVGRKDFLGYKGW